MACYSRIATKITDAARLAEALKAEGYETEIERGSGRVVGDMNGRRIVFEKYGKTFLAAGDVSRLSTIARKYAELGVREFAKRRGFSVVESDGRTMTLVNRRG